MIKKIDKRKWHAETLPTWTGKRAWVVKKRRDANHFSEVLLTKNTRRPVRFATENAAHIRANRMNLIENDDDQPHETAQQSEAEK